MKNIKNCNDCDYYFPDYDDWGDYDYAICIHPDIGDPDGTFFTKVLDKFAKTVIPKFCKLERE